MSVGSKEYFLKLQEEAYNQLPDNEKIYLNNLGMEVRQLPTEFSKIYEDVKDVIVRWLGIDNETLNDEVAQYF